jgi:hypothetical protein
LDLEQTAQIRLEGERLAGGEGGRGSAAIVDSEEVTGVIESGATSLGLMNPGYREEAETKATSRRALCVAGDGLAQHSPWPAVEGACRRTWIRH